MIIKTIYIALHESPRTNSLPAKLNIETVKLPEIGNIYKSFRFRAVKRVYRFFNQLNRNKQLILEYDGNFIPVLTCACVNIFKSKKFKIILDCHVNSYLHVSFFSIRTFFKLFLIYFYKNILGYKILVHNKASAKLINGSYYCPSPFPDDTKDLNNTKPNSIFIISSLNKDEPVDAFIDAAIELEKHGFDIKISGKFSKLTDEQIYKGKDFFTGFLKKTDYFKHVMKSEIIIAMTIRKHNLLFAPREALAYKKICLINDSNENKEFYSSLCVYSSYDSKSIVSNVLKISKKPPVFNDIDYKNLINEVNFQIKNIKKCLHIN